MPAVVCAPIDGSAEWQPRCGKVDAWDETGAMMVW